MQQQVQDYLSFTKKERRGIIVFILLIVSILLIPKLYTYFIYTKPTIITQENKQLLASLIITKDSIQQYSKHTPYSKYTDNETNTYQDYNPQWKNYANNYKGTLFTFDPNTLDQAGWLKLGVYPKTVATILNYTSKGGYFAQPDDLSKIYGLSDYMLEKLMPYVSIKAKPPQVNYSPNTNYTSSNNTYNKDTTNKPRYTTKPDAVYTIDINTADTATWNKLPGIGNKLSERIINYRNKMGGFISINQIAEVYALPDSTFQKIKPKLLCKPGDVTKININTASINLLQHPYINKNVANNILQYRNQHGAYKSIADLKKLALINEELYLKIEPYVTID